MVGLDRSPNDRGTDDLSLATQARQGLKRHWMFATLLMLAAALRGIVFAAYHPALIFPDSVRYLQYAHNFAGGHWSGWPAGKREPTPNPSLLLGPPTAV